MITQTYNLNMIPIGAIVCVHVSQYDDGRTITFNLLNGDQIFTPPSGSTATIDGTKPDKKGFSLSATLSGSTASFVTTRNECAVPGDTICEFRIKQGGRNLGTANFVMRVEPAGLADDVDISETELPEYIDGAKRSARRAEAWAVGTIDGVPVPSTDDAYNNHSKYYSQQSRASETVATNKATQAVNSASNAEAWAVGKRDGRDVPATDPTYHNNSQWYANLAQRTLPPGTTVSFWLDEGDLWCQQTIDGFPQTAQNLGTVKDLDDFVFDTVEEMNTAISNGTVPNGATCYVRE